MRPDTRTKREAWSTRPVFTPKQFLTAHQLNQGLDDELARQRLLNRALHGHGVVFGYGLARDGAGRLDTDHGRAELSCGLALDRHGRILYWPGGRVGVEDLVGRRPRKVGHYTLRVHYAERVVPPDHCGPCAGDDVRWREQGVVFSLWPGCDEVRRDCPSHPKDGCVRHEDYLCQRTGAAAGPIPPAEDLAFACQEPKDPTCRSECGLWLYDPDAFIPIACVEICDLANPTHPERPGEQQQAGYGSDEDSYRPSRKPEREGSDCEPRYGFCPTTPETCSVRPYVYRTPLLYELIRCCDVDLPRVARISWLDWIEGGWTPVPWQEFEERITNADPDHPELGFSIWFTKPIRLATLNPASVFMTAYYRETRTDYWFAQRVPTRCEPLLRSGDFASGVRLTFHPDWIQAEITGYQSTLFRGPRFEITVRGQLMRDACGNMLDARPVDVCPPARCQERPGDDFVSAFRVDRRPPRTQPESGYAQTSYDVSWNEE